MLEFRSRSPFTYTMTHEAKNYTFSGIFYKGRSRREFWEGSSCSVILFLNIPHCKLIYAKRYTLDTAFAKSQITLSGLLGGDMAKKL